MATFSASNVTVLEYKCLTHLFTKIRDEQTSPQEFAFNANRIMRILAEEVSDLSTTAGVSDVNWTPLQKHPHGRGVKDTQEIRTSLAY
jgi:uracil phosphoribosyltransferase